MKKTNNFKNYAGIALLIPVIIGILANLPGCYQSKKASPSPSCDFVGYHLELGDDSLFIYDGSRFVAGVDYRETGKLDSIFIKDNE